MFARERRYPPPPHAWGYRNLVNNALKFTSVGHVAILASRAKGMINIAVEDTGIGIMKKDQERIFETLQQVDGSADRCVAPSCKVCDQLELTTLTLGRRQGLWRNGSRPVYRKGAHPCDGWHDLCQEQAGIGEHLYGFFALCISCHQGGCEWKEQSLRSFCHDLFLRVSRHIIDAFRWRVWCVFGRFGGRGAGGGWG